MADMPQVVARDMSGLMKSVIRTHQQIRDSIHARAEEQQALRGQYNERQNAEFRVGHRTSGGYT